MRQWMVDPKIMCRQHLLGEHVEHHMFIGTINRKVSMAGYLRDNLLEPESLHDRHDELVAEMKARGYNHISPLNTAVWWPRMIPQVKIDRAASLKELLRRCPECRARYVKIYGEPK